MAFLEEEAEQDGNSSQIIDGLPLIEKATELKEQGNACVKKKDHNAAVKLYEQGIAILDQALGHPMLRQELEQVLQLTATLHSNIAQCFLNVKLYRRAVESATACLKIDDKNAKALNRRSQARQYLRQWAASLEDAVALKALPEASSASDLDVRIAQLEGKLKAEEEDRANESSEDEADNHLLKMKARFDEVVEKYDLKNGEAAAEIADWMTSGEWNISVGRVANRFKMELEDADAFLGWIAKGLEFQVQNAASGQQLASSTPAAQSLLD